MDKTILILGNNLKAIREKLGFSQENVANAIGINRSTIAHFESGKRMIPIKHIPHLASFLGIKPNDLLDDNPNNIKLNQVFAFKADNLRESDMTAIADFKRIVNNYLSLKAKIGDE